MSSFTDEIEAILLMYPDSCSFDSEILSCFFSLSEINSFTLAVWQAGDSFSFKLISNNIPKVALLKYDEFLRQNPFNSVTDLIFFINDNLDSCKSFIQSQNPPTLITFPHKILHLPVFIDRKSIFQAHIAPCTSLTDVQSFVSTLLENSKIRVATHNVVAYRYIKDGKLHAGNDDDGEIGCSMPMLQTLEKLNAINVVVMVSRWFGGLYQV
ncbi:hypothetical protein RCL1_006514 [Eukaryota sp. TZLM3-RCL]